MMHLALILALGLLLLGSHIWHAAWLVYDRLRLKD